MKKMLVTVIIKEYGVPTNDPMAYIAEPRIGVKVTYKGKDYGYPCFYSDKDLTNAVPTLVKEVLEEVMK